ncbi:MAG TPA: hypothetical protein VEC93_14950, partial [Anaerolineae bacterium]|nr:hypothetical protein [Anaerolineae bacterium]
MTNQEPVTSIAENLRLGIEAARANQFDQARAYLVKVLQQDSRNLPAMFWLAFVAPSPQESISLLNRVLSLDPDNDRARAGIRWAERRLAAASTPLPDEESEAQTELPDELTRQQLLSNDEVHQRAKKSALAHRARRTIDPLLIMIIIVAAASLLTLGVLALAFGPPETLAAWLPVTVEIEASPDSFQETIAPAAINQALLSSKNVSSK